MLLVDGKWTTDFDFTFTSKGGPVTKSLGVHIVNDHQSRYLWCNEVKHLLLYGNFYIKQKFTTVSFPVIFVNNSLKSLHLN